MNSTVTPILNKYCNDLFAYSRYITREVKIGDIAMGANNPIRIQSMTTTDSMDTIGTVEQSIRIFEAGGEYVRITAPSIKEAENLAAIKKELKTRGYDIPLIADIHFTPNAAEIAARIVEKVRVNPGNYADKKKFQLIEYSDAQYEEEIERIRKRFSPLVRICKEEGTAMRIGTNHGSLSDRIMSRYGDTPIGMVESALEFVRICEDLNYYNLVLSMKASNPQVMVQAYRLLMHQMAEENMNYPIHLGVTEAGDGVDGRVKSAMGIGALLEDGIGDTVRVSLTEAPEVECPVAIDLVNRYKYRANHKEIKQTVDSMFDPFSYNKRKTSAVSKIGANNVPVVIVDFSKIGLESPEMLNAVGYTYSEELDKWNISDQAVDYIYVENPTLSFQIPGTLQMITPYKTWRDLELKDTSVFPLFDKESFLWKVTKSETLNFVSIFTEELDDDFINEISHDKTVVLIIKSENEHWLADVRNSFFKLKKANIEFPVILEKDFSGYTSNESMLYSATDFGGLLIDGFADGLFMKSSMDVQHMNETVFSILQASRTRISKTEYISCPSCGRTLFDLEETTAMIRNRTHHLKGVKIGIMGCIVNGPGEMADADYGYVGSGVGKITLYRGQTVVKKNIPSENAVDELIEIIRSDGNWIEINDK